MNIKLKDLETFRQELERYQARVAKEPGQLARNVGEEGKKRKSQADQLVEVATREAEFFHDEKGEAFGIIKVAEHKEVWPVRSRHFKCWLAGQFYAETKRAPSGEALRAVLNVIEARACFEGPELKLSVRVAETNNTFWYDLANAAWRVVKITPSDWEVVDDAPVLFRRYAHMVAQAEPVPGGNLEELLRFTNVKQSEDAVLVMVYTVTCLVPGIPHPVLVLHGEKGAAKSTTMKVLRQLIDPSVTDLLILPKEPRELVQVLAHHYLPYFDNVDALSNWQSDMLCQAVTGAGFAKRELYSDDDDVIYTLRRCPGLNGINVVATRPDLLDRSILIELERISPAARREEAEFWQEFETARPTIFGAMLDVLSRAMAIYPTVRLPALPRMADFARWGYAVAEALGLGGKTFLEAYTGSIQRQNEEVVGAHPVAAAVLALMEGRDAWKGTAAELLAALEVVAERERINLKAKSWPRAANALTRRLKEVLSNLADAGIQVILHGHGRKGSQIEICKPAGESITTVTESLARESQNYGSDDIGDGPVKGADGIIMAELRGLERS